MRGRVSGLPVERYIGLDPSMGLPLMVCRDRGGRHWVTDGTRSAVVFPSERNAAEFGPENFVYDYSVDRARELLSTVEPIIRQDFPYDALVYANWLVLATHSLLLEYPRGTLAIDRISLAHDSPDSADQLAIEVQGVEKSYRMHRMRPRRRGRMLCEVTVRADGAVTVVGQHTVLDLRARQTYIVNVDDIRAQSREIVEYIVEFVWECLARE